MQRFEKMTTKPLIDNFNKLLPLNKDEQSIVEGNMAFVVTSSKGTTLIHTTGDTIPEANRELFVFEKVNNAWKIAR